MRIKLRGQHNMDEALESLATILQLFAERYGIHDFSNLNLNFTLVNEEGEEVELIDAATSEVFDVLEVHKSLETLEEMGDELEHLEEFDEYDDMLVSEDDLPDGNDTLH